MSILDRLFPPIPSQGNWMESGVEVTLHNYCGDSTPVDSAYCINCGTTFDYDATPDYSIGAAALGSTQVLAEPAPIYSDQHVLASLLGLK